MQLQERDVFIIIMRTQISPEQRHESVGEKRFARKRRRRNGTPEREREIEAKMRDKGSQREPYGAIRESFPHRAIPDTQPGLCAAPRFHEEQPS